jgi:membrane associated rhomboid family serine protease
MFPISDDDSQRRTLPVVTYALVGLNGLVFLLELSAGDRFVENWAFIPANFAADPAANAITIFTAMFMHLVASPRQYAVLVDLRRQCRGSPRPRKVPGLLPACRNRATLAQFAIAPHSTVPNVGASGAIAGVLGAYILMFPQSRVNVLLGRQIVAMPAVIVLGMWIVFQLISGVGTIASTDETANVGGVAYMAHIGGFAAGLLMAFPFRSAPPNSTA